MVRWNENNREKAREKEKGHCHILFAHEISNNGTSKLRIVCLCIKMNSIDWIELQTSFFYERSHARSTNDQLEMMISWLIEKLTNEDRHAHTRHVFKNGWQWWWDLSCTCILSFRTINPLWILYFIENWNANYLFIYRN